MQYHVPELPLVAIDFDGTLADTFAPSPRGRSVVAGYRYALDEIFGEADLLERIGGLKNRAPGQVIDAVLALEPRLGERGLEYQREHNDELKQYVPAGKGIRNGGTCTAEMLTEALVRVRLQFLMPEITPEWPKPFEGALECLAALQSYGTRLAIISSGHTSFIEKTFHAWGARVPDIVVSDDDMRALGLPPQKTCKPSAVLMQTMLSRAYATVCTATCNPAFRVVAYIGDCPIKDRGLAWNSEVRFGWFNPERLPAPQGFGNNEFQFYSWHDVQAHLN